MLEGWGEGEGDGGLDGRMGGGGRVLLLEHVGGGLGVGMDVWRARAR